MRFAERVHRHTAFFVCLLGFAACSNDSVSSEVDDLKQAKPARNDKRDVLATKLHVDLAERRATARIEVAASSKTGASFEVGDLTIETVRDDKGPLPFRQEGSRVDVGFAAKRAGVIEIAYRFREHTKLEGQTDAGLTFTWPSFCGNLFPCKSDPADGVRFELALEGVPDGATAIFPASIEADAPSYMLAWAVGDYSRIDLGKTDAGTSVSVWHLPGEEEVAAKGTAHLVDVFDWYERTYGAYLFGDAVGSVSAKWGAGAFGGMEHHPFWHVSQGSMDDEETHAHEAAHGWFGDGVRIACWEDLTLSEGTTSYLTARALEATAGTAAGEDVWASYEQRLDAVIASQDRIARPEGCNEVDVLNDFWNDVVYMKGAFFYRAVEAEVGRDALDQTLAGFYAKHRGEAASVDDMLEAIRERTGFDAEPLAEGWLRSLGRPDRGSGLRLLWRRRLRPCDADGRWRVSGLEHRRVARAGWRRRGRAAGRRRRGRRSRARAPRIDGARAVGAQMAARGHVADARGAPGPRAGARGHLRREGARSLARIVRRLGGGRPPLDDLRRHDEGGLERPRARRASLLEISPPPATLDEAFASGDRPGIERALGYLKNGGDAAAFTAKLAETARTRAFDEHHYKIPDAVLLEVERCPAAWRSHLLAIARIWAPTSAKETNLAWRLVMGR